MTPSLRCLFECWKCACIAFLTDSESSWFWHACTQKTNQDQRISKVQGYNPHTQVYIYIYGMISCAAQTTGPLRAMDVVCFDEHITTSRKKGYNTSNPIAPPKSSPWKKQGWYKFLSVNGHEFAGKTTISANTLNNKPTVNSRKCHELIEHEGFSGGYISCVLHRGSWVQKSSLPCTQPFSPPAPLHVTNCISELKGDVVPNLWGVCAVQKNLRMHKAAVCMSCLVMMSPPQAEFSIIAISW